MHSVQSQRFGLCYGLGHSDKGICDRRIIFEKEETGSGIHSLFIFMPIHSITDGHNCQILREKVEMSQVLVPAAMFHLNYALTTYNKEGTAKMKETKWFIRND